MEKDFEVKKEGTTLMIMLSEDLKEKAKERRERLENFKAHNDLVCNGIIVGKDND